MREYEYDPKLYARKITFTGAFCAVVLLYAVIRLAAGNNPAIWAGVGVIAAYTVWETFISASNPSKVEVSEESVTFCAYGQRHTYLWSEISQFRVKEFPGARNLFIRINRAGIFRGRYWLHCYYFNDTDELYNFMVEREHQIHPTSLKAQAMDGGRPTAGKEKPQENA